MFEPELILLPSPNFFLGHLPAQFSGLCVVPLSLFLCPCTCKWRRGAGYLKYSLLLSHRYFQIFTKSAKK